MMKNTHWYKTLGFEKNPLEANPLLIDFKITKYQDEIKELEYLLSAGNIVLMSGPNGSGKTTLLKELLTRFEKSKKSKIYYLDAMQINRNKNIEELLMEHRGLLRKITNSFSKETILLLDNAEYLTEENTERIKYFFDQNYLKAVVLSTANDEELKISPSMRKRIGSRVISLRKLSIKDAIVITNKRLGTPTPLKDKLIIKIFKISNENIKEYLVNCAALLRYLVENDKKVISDEELEELLLNNFFREKESASVCYKCGESLTLINDKWRCKHCEKYCLKCGELLINEKKCPRCGHKQK